jgi:purine-binding chemotaxis protein CheW
LKKRKKISFKKILSQKEKEEKTQLEEEPIKKEASGQKEPAEEKEEEKKEIPGQTKPAEEKELYTKKIPAQKDLSENAGKRKTPSKPEEIMIVQVGNEFYGISLDNVEEIRNEIKLTKTPQLSEFLSGIAEIRDLIIPVVNLAKLFGIETENKKEGKIPVIIVEISKKFVGLQVSKIVEIIEIQQTEILPLPDIFPPKLFSGGIPYKSIVVGVINTESLLKGKQIQSFKEKTNEVIK